MQQCEEQYLPELKQYIPLDVDQKDFDKRLQSEWFMPDEYKELDVVRFLNNRELTYNKETVFEKNYMNLLNVVCYHYYVICAIL